MTVQQLFDLVTDLLTGCDLPSNAPVELRIGDYTGPVYDAQIKYDRDTGKPLLVIHS